MGRLTLFAAVVAGSLAFAAPSFAADSSPLVGTWATEAKTDFGTFKADWTVADNGGTWTVEVKDAPMDGAPGGGAPPESTISNVAVDGNTLSFDRQLKLDQGPMTLSYKVTVDGDALAGTAHSDFGDIPITGKRQ